MGLCGATRISRIVAASFCSASNSPAGLRNAIFAARNGSAEVRGGTLKCPRTSSRSASRSSRSKGGDATREHDSASLKRHVGFARRPWRCTSVSLRSAARLAPGTTPLPGGRELGPAVQSRRPAGRELGTGDPRRRPGGREVGTGDPSRRPVGRKVGTRDQRRRPVGRKVGTPHPRCRPVGREDGIGDASRRPSGEKPTRIRKPFSRRRTLLIGNTSPSPSFNWWLSIRSRVSSRDARLR